jgi:JAB domain-containing protein similar to deubiquitination enzymes
MNHLSAFAILKQYGHWFFQKRRRARAHFGTDPTHTSACFKSYRQKVVNQATSTLSEIHMDLKCGDRRRLEFRLEQVNAAFDLVVLVDEALKILREYSPSTPSFSEDNPHYLVSSWFLTDCLSYLIDNPQGHERLHLVTGIKISPNQRTLDRMVKVALKLASEIGALADQHALQKALIEMDRRGHALYGLFHSHPGTGSLATRPSSTDLATHRRYENGGYPLVGAIFVKDGFVRFFSNNTPFTITIYGEGVTPIDQAQHIYQIEKPSPNLSLQAISGTLKWPGYSH